METFRKLTESLARKTTRRNLFGRSSSLALSALLGAAAGKAISPSRATAEHNVNHTVCAFPGPPCPCLGCQASAVCAKPCVVNTLYYSSGCWIWFHDTLLRDVVCCDCDCNGRVPGAPSINQCGCGDDHHNNPLYCPDGNASGPLTLKKKA